MQETQVQPQSQEEPLEKEMATYSSILAWEIPWTEEPGRLQLMGLQKSQTQLSNYKTTAKMSLKLSLSSTILCFCGLALNTIFSSDMHTICESSVYMASLDK